MNTETTNFLNNKLEQTWDQISKEKAVDFLKRSVSADTSVSELLSVLSYEKIQNLKELLGDISLGEVVSPRKYAEKPLQQKVEKTRIRTKQSELKKEFSLVLKAIAENPGVNRSRLSELLSHQLSNRSLAHVSYLLKKLAKDGSVEMLGSRKSATYKVK